MDVPLCKLLKSFEVPSGNDVTHTSMAGGRYYIPSYGIPAFMAAYARVVAGPGRHELSLVEQHRHVGPVLIDIDCKAATCEPIVTQARIESFAREVGAVVSGLVSEETTRAGISMFVMEKPPRPAKPGAPDGPHKHGLHIVLPYVVTRPETRYEMRKMLLPATHRIFVEGTGCLAPAEDVLDEAVIERAGWLMAGSRKPTEPHAWALTQVITWHADGAMTVAKEQLPSLAEQVPLLSIRNKYDETPLSAVGAHVTAVEVLRRQALRDEQQRLSEDREAARARGDGVNTATPEHAEVADLVGMMSALRATAYKSWMQVCLALRNVLGVGDEVRDLWHQFSARPGAQVYDADACDKLWNSAVKKAPGKLSMGSIVHWASKDSPTEYKAWLQTRRRGREIVEVGDRPASFAILLVAWNSECNESIHLRHTAENVQWSRRCARCPKLQSPRA